MEGQWQYQLRLYLAEGLAEAARGDPRDPALRPLTDVLDRHKATLANQLEAFAAYVAEAEAAGTGDFPLYRWTKAVVGDPVRRAKHACTFAVRVAGEEVYPKAAADALEAELRPLVGGGLVARMSRHDTNPASNLPVPPEYRPAGG